MDDYNKQIARNARDVQNLQIKLLLGMAVGFVAGILLAAFVILPAAPENTAVLLLAVATPIVGIFVGQRAVLWALTR